MTRESALLGLQYMWHASNIDTRREAEIANTTCVGKSLIESLRTSIATVTIRFTRFLSFPYFFFGVMNLTVYICLAGGSKSKDLNLLKV